MTSDAYDLANPPAADVWLALTEDARISLVEEAHGRTRSPVGQNATAHASIHVVVENRLAQAHAVVVDAYDRCRAAGLDRHTTIHALASIVARHMLAVLEQRPGFDQASADREYAALDPAAFQRKR